MVQDDTLGTLTTTQNPFQAWAPAPPTSACSIINNVLADTHHWSSQAFTFRGNASGPPAGMVMAPRVRAPAALMGSISALKRRRLSAPASLTEEVPASLPEKLGDHPLRLIIVGHNPSDHAWCDPYSRLHGLRNVFWL